MVNLNQLVEKLYPIFRERLMDTNTFFETAKNLGNFAVNCPDGVSRLIALNTIKSIYPGAYLSELKSKERYLNMSVNNQEVKILLENVDANADLFHVNNNYLASIVDMHYKIKKEKEHGM
jgi:hypothetical protein